jgi:hypothetical protein
MIMTCATLQNGRGKKQLAHRDTELVDNATFPKKKTGLFLNLKGWEILRLKKKNK